MKLSQKLLSGRNSCGVKQCAVKLQFLLLLLDFQGTVYFESMAGAKSKAMLLVSTFSVVESLGLPQNKK